MRVQSVAEKRKGPGRSRAFQFSLQQRVSPPPGYFFFFAAFFLAGAAFFAAFLVACFIDQFSLTSKVAFFREERSVIHI